MDKKNEPKVKSVKINPQDIKALTLKIRSALKAGAGSDGAGGGHPWGSA